MNNSGKVAARVTDLLVEAADKIAPQYQYLLLQVAIELAERHPHLPERRVVRPALSLVGGQARLSLGADICRATTQVASISDLVA